MTSKCPECRERRTIMRNGLCHQCSTRHEDDRRDTANHADGPATSDIT